MWDLRWVLLGLGALVLVGVYLWSRGILSRDMLPALPRRKQRMEPSIGEPAAPPQPAVPEPPPLVETVSEEEKAHPPPDRIVALRLVPRGGCKIDFRVPYTSRKATSKLYSMIIDGREESAGVLDGVVPVTVRSGKVMVEVSVRDAPFRLPVQPVYVANTMNDCSSRALALEIGSAGEALLVWK